MKLKLQLAAIALAFVVGLIIGRPAKQNLNLVPRAEAKAPVHPPFTVDGKYITKQLFPGGPILIWHSTDPRLDDILKNAPTEVNQCYEGTCYLGGTPYLPDAIKILESSLYIGHFPQ